jgi:hypothetical protein
MPRENTERLNKLSRLISELDAAVTIGWPAPLGSDSQ